MKLSWLKRIFHRHQWKKLVARNGTAMSSDSLTGQDKGRVKIVTVLDMCTVCGKYRAAMISATTRQKMPVEYFLTFVAPDFDLEKV